MEREVDMSEVAKGRLGREWGAPAMVMGFMGAFYWAIRGTSGYGGASGGAFAGLGWACLWMYFSHRNGQAQYRRYASEWIFLAIALGITVGGFSGYGIFIAWIRGMFNLDAPNTWVDMSPWVGYLWLFLCGVHWGGATGCFMAWCAPDKPLRWQDWAMRIACGVGGAVLLRILIALFPQVFFPHYAAGYYSDPAYIKDCTRVMSTIKELGIHLGLVGGFLLYEVLRKDWRSVRLILTMAIGFALPFAVGGLWQTLNGAALKIDYWKNWEMSIGLGGGVAFSLAFYFFNQPQPEKVRHEYGIWPVLSILGLATAVILNSALHGVAKIHALSLSSLQLTLGLVGAIALSILLCFLLWRKLRSALAQQKNPWGSGGLFLVLQGLLLLCGYAVSVHFSWQLGTTLLLVLYSIYLFLSITTLFLSRK